MTGGGQEWVNAGANTQTGYHTYGVDWQADTITFYFDGVAVKQMATPADMHQPYYMIANVAVGGYWPGDPSGETSQMKIDYIRAFSNNSADREVGMQTLSSPDGGGTSLYGAAALNVGGGTPITPSPDNMMTSRTMT